MRPTDGDIAHAVRAVEGAALAVAAALLSSPMARAAEEAVPYNNENGAQIFETLGGVLYTVLIIVFFARLFNKRAKFATSTRLASLRTGKIDTDALQGRWWKTERTEPVRPHEAVLSGALALGIATALYQLCGILDIALDGYSLPEEGPLRTVVVALKTMVQGGSYLLTFMFMANGAGLMLMGGRMAVDPAFEREINFKPQVPEAPQPASNASKAAPASTETPKGQEASVREKEAVDA